jgi:hypothetical protein
MYHNNFACIIVIDMYCIISSIFLYYKFFVQKYIKQVDMIRMYINHNVIRQWLLCNTAWTNELHKLQQSRAWEPIDCSGAS